MPAFRQIEPRLQPSGLVQPGPAARPVDLSPVAQGLSQIADKMQQQDDDQAIYEARRKLDQWERATVFDPEKGAVAMRGKDAFALPKMLPEAFDTNASAIADSLPNDRVRMIFKNLALARREQVLGWADRHALGERDKYNEQQYQADIAQFQENASLYGADPVRLKTEIAAQADRVVSYRRGQGRSEEAIAQEVRDNTSKVHLSVLNAMLDSDQPAAAEKYLRENSGSINAPDVLRADKVIKQQMDVRIGMETSTKVVQSLLVKPTDADRLSALAGADSPQLTNLVMQAESGGRRYGPDGVTLLTSPKGAKGEMQVLDSTNTSPGFGVRPARDSSPAERARVGRDYLNAMLQRYQGDVPKALAAYNAGPGAVDKALADQQANRAGVQGADWLSYLPKETQDYVTKIGAAYSQGQGVPPKPTLQDVHQAIRAQLSTARPGALRVALEDATRQFDDAQKAEKQRNDEAEAAALQWLAANGGRFSAMPARLRAAVPADKVDNVMNFGVRVSKGDDVTDPIVFQKMATDDAWLKGLSDAEFYAHSRKLSQADAQQMASRRGTLLNKEQPAGQKPTDLDFGAVNTVLNNLLSQKGMDPTPKDGSGDAQRVGAIRKATWDYVLSAQLQSGKKFTDTDVANKVHELFAKSVQFQTTFLGITTGSESRQLMGMTAGDIPGDVRSQIEADFKKAGVPSPTDGDILGAYLHMKIASAPKRGATGAW